MGKALHSMLIILIALVGPLCYSQSSVKVSDPRLEMVGNTIHISYDILDSDPDDKYNIGIVIKDEEGNTINASALNGDIGEEVNGGTNKKITWNLEADNIYLDAYVFVQINARLIPPPKPVIIEPEEEPVQEEQVKQTAAQTEEPKQDAKTEDLAQEEAAKEEVTKEDVTEKDPPPESIAKSYNRTGLVIQSIALPGLGLSRATGKPHWLRGVAGYGCVAGAIIFNQQATSTYNTIDDLIYFDEINNTYDKAVQQNTVSDILTYAAIGIWVTDFIWTLVGTSDLNEPSFYSHSRGFSFGSNIDPLSNVPLVSVRYRF